MNISPLLPGSSLLGMTGAMSPASKDSPEKIKDAASQFEALLIGEVIKSSQQGSTGWLGDDQEQSGSTALDFGGEYFARGLASNGGLGLARMITKGLEKAVNTENKIAAD